MERLQPEFHLFWFIEGNNMFPKTLLHGFAWSTQLPGRGDKVKVHEDVHRPPSACWLRRPVTFGGNRKIRKGGD